MEHLHPTTFPESLKATLNCYQLTSIDSLSGPSGYQALAAQMWFKENKQLPPIPPTPMVQIPYLIPNDKSAKRSDTLLGGEHIACFIVGGEKRLCLPQILTSVLRDFEIAEINQACSELHIYCSRCLPEQLEILKVLGILPFNTAQCGLITKTDAERLVALLMDQHDTGKSLRERLPKGMDSGNSFNVYHECFGRGYGKFFLDLYVSPDAQCILCEDCGLAYSPQRFVAHSHRSFEKRTCHWGFDPENWRSYLLLPKNLEEAKRAEFEKLLDMIKARFKTPCYDISCPPSLPFNSSPTTPGKRRYDPERDSPLNKRLKEEEKLFDPNLLSQAYSSLHYGVPASALRHSAFRPWSPGLAGINGANPGDMPVIQDLSHLKGLLPFALDRRGYPSYLQNGRPVVLGSRNTGCPVSKFVDSRGVPNVRLASADEQKRAMDNQKSERGKTPTKTPPREGGAVEHGRHDRHDNRELYSPRSSSHHHIPREEIRRKRSLDQSPSERPRKTTTSPVKSQEVSPRNHGLPLQLASPARHLHRRNGSISESSDTYLPVKSTSSSSSLSSNNNHILKESQNDHEISRPISRSREAAATAMLELKSAGSFRANTVSGKTSSLLSDSKCPRTTDSQSLKTPSTNSISTKPTIVPLDSSRLHYRWTIGNHSYIISSSGVQNLEMLRNLVETESGKESGRERIMHELVKMKSVYEEKLDIEMRVRRDLELELDICKVSKRDQLLAATEAKKLIRQDMEGMRQEHSRRLEEIMKYQESLKRQLDDVTSNERRDGETGNQLLGDKELAKLHARIQELETKNDKLRLSLIEERERRQEAEIKLVEAAEASKGRMSLFMETSLSRMMRGVGRRGSEEDVVKSPPFSRSFHSPGVAKKTSQANSQIQSQAVSPDYRRNSLLQMNIHGKASPGKMDTPKTIEVS